MYRVHFSPKAVQELKKIDRIWQKRIKTKIELLAANPTALKNSIKPLKGKISGLARLRVGQYRIVFQLRKSELVILIVRIAHRKDVYKNN